MTYGGVKPEPPPSGCQAALRTGSFTSRRCLTVYPGGNLPSDSRRMGQRLQRGLSLQHFFLGFAGTRSP